ncbi:MULTISPECIES: TetR/AcrR family transcriptional regulator [Streptomyces]|uniref:TetR family transcriptional regulator n=1 Tax=Streptomyces venezuelae TaxID=54571 RepID=A0A5P2AW24_STRVZ|nr:TetR/AcrR family transcriptional regulator [Streptomyces venezuelae]QES21091.1 TetR family transcriptional regulator [Streptomyces venezuelae]
MARPREFDEERVVTAAMETFWRHGYEGTSTRDLCDSTGLGPSSLYNAFGGKRALYLRALDRYHQTGTAEQIALLQGPGTVKDRLRAMMIHAVDADLDEAEGRGCFAINAAVESAAPDEDVREVVRRSFDRVETELYAILAAGRHSGEIRSTGDLRALARRLQSTYYGLRVLGRIQRDRQALLDTVESALADL